MSSNFSSTETSIGMALCLWYQVACVDRGCARGPSSSSCACRPVLLTERVLSTCMRRWL